MQDLAAVLFESDENFRELCDEYRMCSETAVRMEGTAGTAEALRREYAALRLRIEVELLRYLAEHPDIGPGGQ